MKDEGRDAADWADNFVRGSGPTANSADEFLKTASFAHKQRQQQKNETIGKMFDDPEFTRQLDVALDDPDFNWAVDTFKTLAPADRQTVRKALYFGNLVRDATFKRFERYGKDLSHRQKILEIVKPIYDPTNPQTQALIKFSDKGIILHESLRTPRESKMLYHPFYAEDFSKPIHELNDLQFMIFGEPGLSPESNRQAEEVLGRYTPEDLKAMDPAYLMSIQSGVNIFGTPEQSDFLRRYYWSGFDPHTPLELPDVIPSEQEQLRGARVRRLLYGTPEEKIAARKEESQEYWKERDMRNREVDQLAQSLEPALSHTPSRDEVARLLDDSGIDEEKTNDISFVHDVRDHIITTMTAPTIALIRQHNWHSDQQIKNALEGNPKVSEDDQNEIFVMIRGRLISDDADHIVAETKKRELELTLDLLAKTLEKMGYNLHDLDKNLLKLHL